MKIVAQNKKAFHDYVVLENLEVGVVLTGEEVKSIREGRVNLKGSYATIHGGELYLLNTHISPYSHAYLKREEDATRTRKLLAHKRELNKLIGKVATKGITLIPLKMYINKKGRIKLEIGICKHKKAHQKREMLKERDIKRETQRELKNYQ